MSDIHTNPLIVQATRKLALLIGGMTLAALALICIVLLLNARTATGEAIETNAASGPPLLTYIAAIYALMVFAGLALGLPRADSAIRGRCDLNDGEERTLAKLANYFLQRNIIVAASLEGAAIMSAATHLIEKQPLSLVVAGVLIVAIALRFPSLDRTVQWIERQSGLLTER